MQEQLCAGTRIQCALDAKERPLHCHHEKTIVIDDRIAFVGGIDLTDVNGDRFDTNEHVARADVGWHDVSTRIEGPAVLDVAAGFRMRWREVTGEQLSPAALPLDAAPAAGPHTVQIVRTIPEKVYDAEPRGDFRILESYLRGLRSARSFVYLENQFLWSPEIAAVLRDKLERPPSDTFRIVLVLPAKPNSGGDDTRGMLAELIDADDGAGRLLACTLYGRHGRLSEPVYVHAKIGIVDDRWLTIGSANLNEHSLFNDTEMNIVCQDPDLVRRPGCASGQSISNSLSTSYPADPTQAVDRYGSQSARSNSSAATPANHSPTASPPPRRQNDRDVCSVPSTVSREAASKLNDQGCAAGGVGRREPSPKATGMG